MGFIQRVLGHVCQKQTVKQRSLTYCFLKGKSNIYTSPVLQNSQKGLIFEYTPQEERKVLKVFNTASEEDVIKLGFTGLEGKRIIDVRKNKERFWSLDCLSDVDGVNEQTLKDVIQKIILTDTQHMYMAKKNSLKLFPRFPEHKAETLTSFAVLDFSQDFTTWVAMDRNGIVTDVSSKIVFENPNKRYDHIFYHKKICEVVEALPQVDLYLLERKNRPQKSKKMINFLQQQMVLEAMLITLLNKDFGAHSLPAENKVHTYPIRPIAGFHELYVGGELVGSQAYIENLLKNIDTVEDVSGMNIPYHFRSNFVSKEDPVKANRFSLCLLAADAFYKCNIASHFHTGAKPKETVSVLDVESTCKSENVLNL